MNNCRKSAAVLLIAVLVLSLTAPAWAAGVPGPGEGAEAGAFQYDVLPDGSARLTEYTGGADSLIVPAELDGIPVREIGDYALAFNGELRSVTVPEGVETVGSFAFSFCSALETAVLPESLKDLGEGAFCGCVALRRVTIPGRETSIGKNAFLNCPGLSLLLAEDSRAVTDAEEQNVPFEFLTLERGVKLAGQKSGSFRYDLMDDDTIRLTGYTGSAGRVIIPATIGGYPVTEIGRSAFYNCDTLMNVKIPESVDTIGNFAFAYCGALRTVSIPKMTASVGSLAFYETPWLQAQPAEDGWVRIGGSDHYVYTGAEKRVAVPAYIRSFDFNCSAAVTEVTLHDGITAIDDHAFQMCDALQSVTFPEGLTTVGDGAFAFCASLGSVSLPAGVRSIGKDAFHECSSLRSVAIPEGVEEIRDFTFTYCSALTSVSFPDSLRSIGEYAFSGCASLALVSFPEGVETIGEFAFCDCPGLTSVVLPATLKSLGGEAFSWCGGLQNVVFRSEKTEVGGLAFYGTPWLLTQPAENDWVRIGGHYVYVGSAARLVIPGEIRSFDLNRSRTVQRLTVPAGVTAIGGHALEDCAALRTVTLREGLTAVGPYAFCGCDSLRGIVLPESVTAIGDWAFSGCDVLTNVVIPSGVKTIGENTFFGCGELSLTVTACSRAEELARRYKIPYELTVPSVKIADLVSGGFTYNVMTDDTVWLTGCPDTDRFLTIPAELDGLPVAAVGEYAFSGSQRLRSVTIPGSVRTVGAYAFANCPDLMSAKLEEGAHTIGDYAFAGCVTLMGVRLPESVRSIGERAFSGCSSLLNVTVSEGVKDIGEDAFAGCGKLSLRLTAGTPAEAYAIANNLPYKTDTPAPTPTPAAAPTPAPTAEPSPTPTQAPAPTPTPVPLRYAITDEMLGGAARPRDDSWFDAPRTGQVVNAWVLALHWGPSMRYNESLALHGDDLVEMLAQENGWTLIRTIGGKYRWANSYYLREVDLPLPTATPAPTENPYAPGPHDLVYASPNLQRPEAKDYLPLYMYKTVASTIEGQAIYIAYRWDMVSDSLFRNADGSLVLVRDNTMVTVLAQHEYTSLVITDMGYIGWVSSRLLE